MIWFHFTDFTGNHDDYCVTNWEAAREEAVTLMACGLHYCDAVVEEAIKDLIADGEWQKAVEKYNEGNWVGEHILFREGKRVYEP